MPLTENLEKGWTLRHNVMSSANICSYRILYRSLLTSPMTKRFAHDLMTDLMVV